MRSRYHQSRPGGSVGFSGLVAPQPKLETTIAKSAAAKLAALMPEQLASRARFIAAAEAAHGLALEAAAITAAAMDLADRDWGAGDNRVIAGLAADVSRTSIEIARASALAQEIASPASNAV